MLRNLKMGLFQEREAQEVLEILEVLEMLVIRLMNYLMNY